MVRQSSPIKKSKKAKTERGRIWGSASMTKIGMVRKSHVTSPQNTRPADAKMINFFFFDNLMSFIAAFLKMKVSRYKCYMSFEGGGISSDAKKSKRCCQKGSGSTFAETCSGCSAIYSGWLNGHQKQSKHSD